MGLNIVFLSLYYILLIIFVNFFGTFFMALDNKKIARRIREIRGFDRTQKKFAQMLGASQATVSKLEKGLVLPNSEILLKLSGISGKSIDWILKGED